MWSRKPTPVLRSPAPVPSSASVSLTCVSFVSRSISAVRSMESAILADLQRRCVDAEALGPCDGRRRARELRRRAADADLRHPPAERADGQPGGEACRSARWQRVVRAGDVVAECDAALGADE